MQDLIQFNKDSSGFHYRQRQLGADPDTGLITNDHQAKVKYEDVSG